jgi:hypothetical protein
MRKYRLIILCLLAFSASALATYARAQSAPTPTPPAASPELTALGALPDSDAVIVLNLRRLLTEALPRLLSGGKNQEMEAALTVMQLFLGSEVGQIDSIVMGLKEPETISAREVPPLAVVVHGSFDSEKVIDDVRGLFQEGPKRPAREEQYRGRKIFVFDVEDVTGPPSAPALKVTIEFSATLLDPNLLALGRLADMKRTIDAREGYGQIRPALVKLATLRPNAVMSVAAIGRAAREPDIISASAQEPDPVFEVLNAVTECALSVEALNEGLEFYAYARTGSPDQAQPLEELLISLLRLLAGSVKDPQIKAALNNPQVKREGDQVHIRALLPQKVIASYVSQWPTFAPLPTPVVDPRKQRGPQPRRGRPRRRARKR